MQVEIPADIQRRTDKINEEFHQFQLDFAEEKRRRAAKEAEILGILADSEHNTATKFDEIRVRTLAPRAHAPTRRTCKFTAALATHDRISVKTALSTCDRNSMRIRSDR